MMKLPQDYIERTRSLLGEEAESFLQSYQAPRTQGLRLNPFKITVSDPAFSGISQQFQLEGVPWCTDGFYYAENSRPGKHPYHAAGVYYIQEPSAMSAVELLQPVPGDIVLDLAAAPGGKSTQIAGKLKGTGLLIANEIHPARAKILSENIERMGIANAVVINASPDKLSELFPVFFDKIMLDAPCSGEGMFRKDPQAVEEWSVDHVKMCAARQMDILPEAVKMLKPGGVMAYSTCTFNREENEDTIGLLLEQYGELELLGTERIWPHRHKGEGHFVAILRKNPASHEATAFVSAAKSKQATGKIDKTIAEAMKQFTNFQEDTLPGFTLGAGEPLLFGDQLYWLPHSEGCPFAAPMLQGLKTPRPGLHLGMLKKNRFEPSHALALALSTDLAASASLQFDVNAGSDEIAAYLHGEALFTGRNSNGWVIVTVDGFPVGWGKESTGQLKNHYPKGLRWVLGVQSK